MAQETDSPVLKMVGKIGGRLDKRDERFDRIVQRLDTMAESLRSRRRSRCRPMSSTGASGTRSSMLWSSERSG